ncbi:polymorphic toxin type 44 domain-containing protein [Saccharopolyspora sp. TS4A08]|uniref:Polymorphic toxin type 44 domain-containing protein n=1 Tax=Saccharopolyspora ipomoeae TaxID=3042027 RepID=A0ABT6PKP8_9PSEU|nr:polymorphic toxin type 44 domain-containing protein [Saccharopolyspora sp. TS4A08]MDI2028061.1 polymorphic toxin type 44 domain-containing protein [Saccharopolyspora sp. TS4A08]
MNYASRQFFSRAVEAEEDNPKFSADELAQEVQRSAYPGRYAEAEDRARDLLENAESSGKRQDSSRSGGSRKRADWADLSEARFNRTLEYIYGEMMTNGNSAIAWAIWALNFGGLGSSIGDIAGKLFGGPEWAKWLELVEQAAGRPTPTLIFAVKVAPGMDWDHKPKIAAREDLDTGNADELYFKIPGDDEGREVFYDIWSNVHYGYVGRSCGFDEDVLHTAPTLPGTGEHDKGDVLTMQAGMDLWDEHEQDLTLSQLRAKVHQVIDQIDDERPNLQQVRKWTAP